MKSLLAPTVPLSCGRTRSHARHLPRPGTALFLLFSLFALAPCVVPTASVTNCRVTVVGAGFGGLYAAFRLQNDTLSGYSPGEICVVEKSDRAGGRALNLPSGIFPSKNVVSLGAHRWDPDVHIIVDSVVEKVLGLHTACYYRNDGCSDDGASYFFLRNNYTGDLSSSKGLPYFLKKSEKWSKRTGPADVVEEIASGYPFLADMADDLVSPDPSVRYPAIKQATDMLRGYAIDGALPNQLTIRTTLNRSSEYWELLVSAWGEAIYILDLNVYDLLRDEMVSGYSSGALKVIVDSQGNEIGYEAKDTALAQLLVSQGVSVQYNKELVSLLRNGDGTLLLRFADGSSFSSEKVILNIGATQLKQLSHDSVVFREASPTLRRMYDKIVPTPAVKAYGYFPKAWWVNDDGISLSAGYVSTDTQANYYDFSDSATECNANGNHCSGWFNMAYPDGEYYHYFRTIKQDPDSALTYIFANTTDPQLRRWYWDFYYQFATSLCEATNQKKCKVPAPTAIAIGIWDEAWYDFLPSEFPGGSINAASTNPAPGVYWANEANSRMQGWAEGSAWMAETVVNQYFGLARPSWLGEPYWYANVIQNLAL